jgi:hypothetical protein
MTLFGPNLHDLNLEDIQAFLDAADAEPLLWEAKGTKVHPDSVRKHTCGFANGRQTAYLILGAERDEATRSWSLPGVSFRGGDPPAWVSSVVSSGLEPVPDIDVQPLPVGKKKHVAIVEVPPVAAPPCISNGVVWERISGQTVEVKSPLRLSELYGRGDVARRGAQQFAVGAASELVLDNALDGWEANQLRFAVAVSATGHPPKIGSRLFSEPYEESIKQIANKRLVEFGSGPFSPASDMPFSQSNRTLNIHDPYSHATRRWWVARVIWNGTAVVHLTTDAEYVPAKDLAQLDIKPAWIAAWELVDALGGYGPTYMELRVEGGQALKAVGGGQLATLSLGRGPLDTRPDDDQFASMERELRRWTGEAVYEVQPEPEPPEEEA